MKNLNELKVEYVEYMNKLNEIEKKIEYVVDENKEIPYDSLFFYFFHPEYEAMKDNDEEWQRRNKDFLQKKFDMYIRSVNKAVETRNKLFEEKYKIESEYYDWLFKNNISHKEFKELGYIERYKIKWRGWDFSKYVYESMIYSINLTDEKEVNEIISNMKKVIKMMEDEDKDNHGYMSEEYIEYLEIVNNETRHRLDEGCMSTLALDVMENHCVYNAFKESFKQCIYNISEMVDRDYLSHVRYMNKQEK